MQPRLERKAERAGGAVADEEEAITAGVPPEATEVIVEVSLISLRISWRASRRQILQQPRIVANLLR
jgi:hypothetical protein